VSHVPERYWRFPGDAIESLSARFGLLFDESMQDWEYQVADASRLGEFLAALEGDDLTDNERFTLGQIVMRCFEDLCGEGRDVPGSGEWQRFVTLLRARPALHAFTLCYWSALPGSLASFCVSPLVRPLWSELEPVVLREMAR
jgi:hypothetical protein